MNAGAIMGLVIYSIVALIMVLIGVCEFRNQDKPVGLNIADEPKKEEITDVVKWNRAHGMLWILYGIIIELSFFLGYIMPNEVLQMICLIGGVIIPLPLIVLGHRKLEGKYRVRGDK